MSYTLKIIKLQINLPTQVFFKQTVNKITADGEHGAFTILPRHCDYIAPLITGIVTVEVDEGSRYIAIDEGILVKIGEDVNIITHQAYESNNLLSLKEWLSEKLDQTSTLEKKARCNLSKLELSTIKKFINLKND